VCSQNHTLILDIGGWPLVANTSEATTHTVNVNVVDAATGNLIFWLTTLVVKIGSCLCIFVPISPDPKAVRMHLH
jgi:hypothetical protein